jgi:4-hydroxy-3-methylbut-2-enyl diphosphate reductase
VEVTLANPRGFCAGVVRAIDIVDLALEAHGPPVYVFHEIVHNQHVVEDLRAKGAVFVDDLTEVPRGAVTVFSAHGVSDAVWAQAQTRALKVIDATCPLVTKVHLEARKYSRRGYGIVIIGHHGHEEVEGTMGSVQGPVYLVSTPRDVEVLEVAEPSRLAYVTQTTLSLDDTSEVIEALRTRFPGIMGPQLENICYATQNRQNAVKQLAQEVDVILVVGARNSSNSNRLREVAEQQGVEAHLIADETELEAEWVAGRPRVGVTAGASAPELLVRRVVSRLRELGADRVEELRGNRETVMFKLPEALAVGRRAARWENKKARDV